MKTIKFVTKGLIMLALAALTGITGFAQDKNPIVTQDRTVPEFSAIDIDLPVKVVLSQGETALIRIAAPEKAQEKIKPEVKNNTLTFDINGNTDDITLYITAKNINNIKVSGSTELKGESVIKSEKLEIEAEGASQISMDLDVTDLGTEVSGASDVTLTGTAVTHKSEVSGAASLKAMDLRTKKTEIEVSGAGSAKVDATDELKGEVSGAGDLSYKSKPPVYSVEESGAASSGEVDTTKLKFGDKHVMIFKDKFKDGKCPVEESRHKGRSKKDRVKPQWMGLDFGINGYLDKDFKLEVPEGRAYLEPEYSRSFEVGLNVIEFGIPLVRNHITLVSGLGFDFNNYFYKNNYRLLADSATLMATQDPGASYDKNTLSVSWVRIPLLLQFDTKKLHRNSTFHFSIGVIGALKMCSYTKQVWTDQGIEYKATTKDDFNLSPLKADATVRLGYGYLNLFVNYSLNSMFRSGQGPQLFPFTIGITLLNI